MSVIKVKGKEINNIVGFFVFLWLIFSFISGIIFTWEIGIKHSEILIALFTIYSFWKYVFIIIGLIILTILFMFIPPIVAFTIPLNIINWYRERKKNENRKDRKQDRSNPILN